MADVTDLDKKVAHAVYRMLEQQSDYQGAYEIVANHRNGAHRLCGFCAQPQSEKAKKCNGCFRNLLPTQG